MTELTTPIKIEIPGIGTIESAHLYLKSEADKVIENIVKGASSMFREFSCCRGLDTESPLGRIADVAFKHWTDVEHTKSNNRQLRLDKANLLRSNENLCMQLKSEKSRRLTDELEYSLNIRHNKYKRCLAMADYSMYYHFRMLEIYGKRLDNDRAVFKINFCLKWHYRWLELAEKFKEAK